ncbi:MAG TPA: sulfite reductase subunit alpha [Gemmataceae bacterium]|jgi:sulfite reductase (NADPH) flavoprotein alpha-component|nr:sulfite reductase subunit alpha [Gemmataceae bacterium]
MTVAFLPESAPFSTAQRAWLNGFFAGAFGPQSAVEPPKPAPEPEDFPWHDPAMPMDERLKLAETRPFERKLMAAMAQLDCGSCGYLCETYAEAIARGEETDLTKCSPGGKETFQKLKELMAGRTALPMANGNGHAKDNGHSNGSSGSNGSSHNGSNGKATTPAAKEAHGRSNPFMAPLLECQPLSKAGSEKEIRFASFNLKGSGLAYEVGDALGVYPENCPDLVEAILKAMGSRGDDLISSNDGRVVHSYEALIEDFTITKISDRFIKLLADSASDPSEASTLQALLSNDPDGVLEAWDVLDLLEQFPSARPPVPKMIEALSPLQPRLYSISSSLKAHPDEVQLTVGVVRYSKGGRVRKGVASTFLAELLRPRQKVGVFVHPSKGFRLPADPTTPILMVGPGTGVAPFRAFLEDRAASGARGKNWLFFGDQRRDYDFLYQEELEGYLKSNVLTRLDLAFSRDQDRKVYVQHRMKENAAEIWAWLEEGAHFYVCGDARRMALDVDHMLHGIVAAEGKMSPEKAAEYVKALSKAKRYQRDVY